jgi:hypothetical protein
MEINDFENREKRLQMVISKEAWYSENMANLFLIEIAQGQFDDFNSVAKEAFGMMKHHFPAVALTKEELACIRSYLRQLLTDWNKLPSGETMTLTFEL